MTAICQKHGTESVVTKTATGCTIHCNECNDELANDDSHLLNWLEMVGGEIQFSHSSCKWWVNWYNGVDGTEHRSGRMFDTIRQALKSAYLGEYDT
jgi:hypothetical protein